MSLPCTLFFPPSVTPVLYHQPVEFQELDVPGLFTVLIEVEDIELD